MGLTTSTAPLSEEQLVMIEAEAGRKRRQRRQRRGQRPGAYVKREERVRGLLEAWDAVWSLNLDSLNTECALGGAAITPRGVLR